MNILNITIDCPSTDKALALPVSKLISEIRFSK